MNLQQIFTHFRSDDTPVRSGLVGAGEFGATYIAQARRMPHFETSVVCDRDIDRAKAALLSAGYTPDEFRVCLTENEAGDALAQGLTVITDDSAMMMRLPIDVVVEATGDPEGAAMSALAAIQNGKHSVMVTKEAEVVIGPILAEYAKRHNVVHTPVDGDQPSLLIGLVGWANMLGLPVVCGGKSSESDFVWDPDAKTITAWNRTVPAHDYGRDFHLTNGTLDTVLERRADLPFERTTVPDLCEMGIVANHTGLMPDTPALHAPIARTVELPSLFRPKSEGGLLGQAGCVDMFNCLRRPDELSFAGGVFVVAEASDPASGKLFKAKGIPTCPEGRYILLHNPVHLLGAEAPLSALSAARFKSTTGTNDVRPRVDLVAQASRDLAPGDVLSMGARHVIDGLTHVLQPAEPIGKDRPLPYYLATGNTVIRAVKKGAILTCGDVALPHDTVLMTLRREQDALFFS